MKLPHLDHYGTYLHGPIQQDEALFLYSVVKMIRPKTIVEFGIQSGWSTLNFARAKDRDCHLYSFDISGGAVEQGRSKVRNIPNCILQQMDCVDFAWKRIDKRPIDICFLDCSHNLNINQICIKRFMPHLTEGGIVAIHDTGVWTREAFQRAPDWYKEKATRRVKSLRDKRLVMAVVGQERKTVRWLLNKYPSYSVINFHSENFFRHGITLIQKKDNLSSLPEQKEKPQKEKPQKEKPQKEKPPSIKFL